MRALLLVILGLAIVVPQARAQPSGAEFRVNTTTASYQELPAVAGLVNGDFVVAWTSSGQDGSLGGVYGQRHTAAGVRIGGEFRINSTTARDQSYPSIAALTGGGFVVTWDSQDQDGSGYGIYGQRYTAAGVRVGGEFKVNTTIANDQYDSSVAGLSDGGFVVTWSSFRGGPGRSDIYGQRYDAAGAPAGAEFRVNRTTTNNQTQSSVAGLVGGGFVAIWNSWVDEGQNHSAGGVYGQLYDGAGAPVGTEFRANTRTAGDQYVWYARAVAALTGGGFVVTWTSVGQDGSGGGIYGQIYSAAAAPVGSEFQINTRTADDQYGATVAPLGNGGFAVTWSSHFGGGNGYDVYGQLYNPAGARRGGEFRVNTHTADDQYDPAIARLSGGGFVVVWPSQFQDGSRVGVYGQRFTP